MWDNIVTWWQSIKDFLYMLVLTVFDFLNDFFFWILDELFAAAISFLDLTSSALTGLNPLQYIDAIPNETKSMMAMTGFNEIMAILVIAMITRFTLQLIPFVRWGS